MLDDLPLNTVKVSHKRFVVQIIQNKKNKFQNFSIYFERFEGQTVQVPHKRFAVQIFWKLWKKIIE